MDLVLLDALIAGVITIRLIDLDQVIWLIGGWRVLILDVAQLYWLEH